MSSDSQRLGTRFQSKTPSIGVGAQSTSTTSRTSSPGQLPGLGETLQVMNALSVRRASSSPLPNLAHKDIARRSSDGTPVSIDFEYRSITITTTHILIDIKNFKTVYKMDKVDPLTLSQSVYTILEEMEVDRIVAQDRRELYKIFTSKDRRQILSRYREESTSVVLVIKQAKHFEYLIEKIPELLRRCFDTKLRRYCVSYHDEPKTSEVPVVLDYQDYILRTTDFINASLNSLELEIKEYSTLQELFLGSYMENLSRSMHLIDSICGRIVILCNTMKQWVARDKNYPKKLWEFIISTNMKRGKYLEDMKRAQRKKSELNFHIVKRQQAQERVCLLLEEKQIEERRIDENKEGMKDKLEQTVEDLNEKRSELEDVAEKIVNRKTNSPKYIEMLQNKSESLSMDVSALMERKKALKRQTGKLDLTLRNLGSGLRGLEMECAENIDTLHVLRGKMEVLSTEVQRLEKQGIVLEERVSTARHIRGLKVSSSQLRKIYERSVNP